MSDGRPVAPPDLQLYDSYDIDPQYARHFTTVWTSAAAVLVLFSLPKLYRSFASGRFWQGWAVWEDFGRGYQAVSLGEKGRTRGVEGNRKRSPLYGLWSLTLWTPPFLRLDVGQLFVLAGYLVTLLVCMTHGADLVENANRAGFLALAQLSFIFLFATKNNILSILLGKGYEKLNFLHRWSGRALFLTATIHGACWIQNHIRRTPQKLKEAKEVRGMVAYGLLGLIMLLSLRPLRKWGYQFFFVTHILGYVAFFITICYHTPCAAPWIIPPLAFYAADIFVRMLRLRFKDANLIPLDPRMTLIQVKDCDGGWIAGQHVRLCVFFSGRVFESHPLTISNAPRSHSVQSSSSGIMLGARVAGDWTRALNALASQDEKSRRVMVMMDGPYGGLSFDLGEYENVLLVAGGSGVTFTLGVLDDLVGRIVKLGRRGGERTKRIEFAWCIKSFGAISWFSSQLMEIVNAAQGSSIDLRIQFYVTCLCVPEAAPDIPNATINISKPTMHALLESLISPTTPEDLETSVPAVAASSTGGGLAVAVSGPESLTTEARNVVSQLGPSKVRRMGGVSLHTELFAL